MARFVVEETISDGQNRAQIWDRLRQYIIDGRTVELVRRSRDGEPVIEVRRWTGIRNDRSNLASASSTQDY